MTPNRKGPEISAWLNIGGYNWDPVECSQVVGIEATELRRSKLLGDDPRGERSVWRIGFRRRKYDDTNDALCDLLDMVWSRKEALRSFVLDKHLDITIDCNITIWDERPLYSFGTEVLQKLAWFECELILDIYDYSDDDNGD